jgi:hypothetical protein
MVSYWVRVDGNLAWRQLVIHLLLVLIVANLCFIPILWFWVDELGCLAWIGY